MYKLTRSVDKKRNRIPSRNKALSANHTLPSCVQEDKARKAVLASQFDFSRHPQFSLYGCGYDGLLGIEIPEIYYDDRDEALDALREILKSLDTGGEV